MNRRTVALCSLLVMLASWLGAGSELRVPEEYPTIQLAVNAARSDDIILIAPGIYFETIWIEERRGLTLRGESASAVDPEQGCLISVMEAPPASILSGSIRIRSSERILIESLTITGPGPGIHIEGVPRYPALDVSVRHANLVNNEGSALELTGAYFRVSVACSRIASVYGAGATGIESLRTRDIHLTCTLQGLGGGGGMASPSLEPVVVAVIDSGIDRSIEALRCYLWHNPGEIGGNGLDDDGNGYVDDIYGWDFCDEDADVLVGSPIHWHGTFVAGVLVDSFEGLAWPVDAQPPLRIMDLRFLDSQGQFYPSDWENLARAIEYAVNHGARVINLSLYATRSPPPRVREAVLHAVAEGVLVVGIAGNGSSVLGPIANWEEVLTVAAVDVEGEHAAFSDIGPEVDLSALGVDVVSFLLGGGLGARSGTSFAAPHVAGTAAFHVLRTPTLSLAELELLLRLQALEADAPGHDPKTGWGVIQ